MLLLFLLCFFGFSHTDDVCRQHECILYNVVRNVEERLYRNDYRGFVFAGYEKHLDSGNFEAVKHLLNKNLTGYLQGNNEQHAMVPFSLPVISAFMVDKKGVTMSTGVMFLQSFKSPPKAMHKSLIVSKDSLFRFIPFYSVPVRGSSPLNELVQAAVKLYADMGVEREHPWHDYWTFFTIKYTSKIEEDPDKIDLLIEKNPFSSHHLFGNRASHNFR